MNSAYLSVQSQCDGNKILASADVAKLEKEKTDLTKKLDSLHQFLDSRVTWTTYTPRHLSLPAGQYSTQPVGKERARWRLGKGKAEQSKKSLQLAATAPLTANGAVPPEVGKFVALAAHATAAETRLSTG